MSEDRPAVTDTSPEHLRALFPDVAALVDVPAAQQPKLKRPLRGRGRTFQRKGSAHVWIAYYRRGEEIRESSGSPDPKAAERLLHQRLKEVAAEELGARPFVGPKQERITVDDLLDALEKDYQLQEGHAPAQFRAHLKPVRAYFEGRRAVGVTPDVVDRYIEARRAEGKAPATVNRETQLLGQAYRLAVRRGRLATMPYIRHLPERNVRDGFFERADFEGVASHLPPYLQDFARFGYLTGIRRGRLASMRWTDVDRDGGVVWLHRGESRNKRGTKVALEGELGKIIARRWEARHYPGADGQPGASPYVFHRGGRPIGDIRKAWASACKAAGMVGRLFHDMRRSAIRNMVRAGVRERVAMDISGHRTRAVFDRYNVTSEEDLRDAMQRTQTYLETLPAERPADGAGGQNTDSRPQKHEKGGSIAEPTL